MRPLHRYRFHYPHEFISAERPARDLIRVFAGTPAELVPEVVLDGQSCPRPDVVGDPGEEPDLDRVVEVGLGRPVHGVPLDDGVAELRADLRKFFGETSL